VKFGVLHNEKFRGLYRSHIIIIIIMAVKSRILTRTGYISKIGKTKNACRILVKKSRGK